MHLTGRMVIGIIIILIGLSALFSTLGTPIDFGQIVVPVIFFFIGYYFWQQERKLLGGILAGMGAISFFNHVLHINIAGILLAALMVYFGYRLLREDREAEDDETWWENWDTGESETEEVFQTKKMKKNHQFGKKRSFEDDIDREIEKLTQKVKHAFSNDDSNTSEEQDYSEQKEHTFGKDEQAEKDANRKVHQVSSVLGDFVLLNHRFELHNMRVNNGLGDVKIDLSKAIIPPGETTLEINGWLGDIQVYVPYDLEVSVQASVLMGELNILEYQQDGFSRRISTKSSGYEHTSKRVNLTLSLILGEIDVRYV